MLDLTKFQTNGKFLMLALDHRGSFKKYINPNNPEAASQQELIQAKAMIIESVQDQFSGLLIDLDWGLPAYAKASASQASSMEKPFLLPLEKSGYMDNDGEKITELEYSAQQLKEQGASGTKLLLYFNPEAASVPQQIKTAQMALADSHANNLPFFLEIVTYGNEESGKTRAEWVLRSVEILLENNVIPDVWKLEYPGDLESCEKVSKLVGQVPWILLTRGEKFAVFEKQLTDAVNAGAVGFLAGRALWQEVSDYKTEKEKKEFLNTVVADRFKKISEICLSSRARL